MEVCMTDIKLVLLPQAHFFLFRKDNTQKNIPEDVFQDSKKN